MMKGQDLIFVENLLSKQMVMAAGLNGTVAKLDKTTGMWHNQESENSLRTSKTVDGVKTEYFWSGDTLIGQKTGSDIVFFNSVGFNWNTVLLHEESSG